MTIPRAIKEGLVCYYCEQPDWRCIQTNCNEPEEGEEEEDEENDDQDHFHTPVDVACDLATNYSADPRDQGIHIPETWYQSPLWRKEMQENAKATMAGDFSWVEKKFAEYVERAQKCTP